MTQASCLFPSRNRSRTAERKRSLVFLPLLENIALNRTPYPNFDIANAHSPGMFPGAPLSIFSAKKFKRMFEASSTLDE